MKKEERPLTRLEIEAIIKKLGGPDKVREILKAGQQFVDPTWKKVMVGTLRSAEVARRVILAQNSVSDQADQILEQIKFDGFIKTINLTLVKVKSLNFLRDEKATTERVMINAMALGLLPCPPEAALQLLLQHPRALPEGESALVGMNPISPARVRTKLIFKISRNSLGTDTGHPQACWHDKHQWVFVYPEP